MMDWAVHTASKLSEQDAMADSGDTGGECWLLIVKPQVSYHEWLSVLYPLLFIYNYNYWNNPETTLRVSLQISVFLNS